MLTKPRLYLDACCFIDLAKVQLKVEQDEERKKDVWHLQKLLLASQNGEIDLFTSTVTIAECTHVTDTVASKRILDEEVKKLFRSLLTSGKVVRLVQPDVFIAEEARNLRWDHQISSKIGANDLVHLASAGNDKIACSEFLTTEFTTKHPQAKLKLESVLGLRIIRPSATSHLPMEYLQESLSLMPGS